MACHDPNRVVQGQTNPLGGWFQSIHATATDTVANLPYPTLDQNACLSCHSDHNAPGNQGLLRGAGDQVCLNCHSGTSESGPMVMKASLYTQRNGAPPSVIAQPAKSAMLNVAAEYAKTGHPVATANANPIRAKAQTKSQAALMVSPNTPGQSGCIDCHDPHAVQSVGAGAPLAPSAGATQKSVMGVSEKDGSVLKRPAQAQYQTC